MLGDEGEDLAELLAREGEPLLRVDGPELIPRSGHDVCNPVGDVGLHLLEGEVGRMLDGAPELVGHLGSVLPPGLLHRGEGLLQFREGDPLLSEYRFYTHRERTSWILHLWAFRCCGRAMTVFVLSPSRIWRSQARPRWPTMVPVIPWNRRLGIPSWTLGSQTIWTFCPTSNFWMAVMTGGIPRRRISFLNL